MLVIPSAIITFLSPLDLLFLNAVSAILVTVPELCIVNLMKLVQPLNAVASIFVKVHGIVTSVRPVQP